MATGDVMPFNAEHGGHNRVITGEMGNAAGVLDATFRIGEFVLMDIGAGVGDMNEMAAGTTVVNDANIGFHYVAATDSQFNIGRLGDVRYADPPAVAPPCSLYPLDDVGALFVTRNAFNGDNVNIGPAGSNTMAAVTVGVVASPRRGAVGDHGIDVATAGFRIIRILDATGRDTFETGAAADKIIFKPDPIA